MTAPRCLIVEDEDLLGELLLDNLTRDGFAAERVADGAEALQRASSANFDLIVLDVMLPSLDGFAVLEALRSRGHDTPVLILSARSGEADRIRGLELQADDYLAKPFNLRELLLRCHALLRRSAPARPRDVLEFGGNRIDFAARKATTWRGADEPLTPSELTLLALLAERPGEVVDRRELVDAVFGRSTPVKHRTLDNLVLRLRRLFERDTRAPQHLHTVRGVGLRFDLQS